MSTALNRVLKMVTFLGAARADATAEQLALLRSDVMPLMHGDYQQTGDETPIRKSVAGIMGYDWQPTGEWAAYLRKLD